jgi:hypothetical protein
MDCPDLERRLDPLASLAAPVRLALYRCVAGREQGLGRDEAAAAVGISRKLAAYHLDKLADAVRADPLGAARVALEGAARAAGAENAIHADEDHSRPRDAADVHAVLARHGYEPYDDEGVTRLRNCPFQRLAQTHRELVCRANLAFVEGLIQGLTARSLRAVLDPRPGRCCVALS